ncbi:MAG: ADP-ribosylglycohydrolase family protein [Acidimicrobiales bacterium]
MTVYLGGCWLVPIPRAVARASETTAEADERHGDERAFTHPKGPSSRCPRSRSRRGRARSRLRVRVGVRARGRRDGGRGALTGRPAGSWTDDTDMAVGIATVAARGHRLDKAEGQALVAEQFLSWYADHPPDIGNQTRAVLSSTTDPALLSEVAAAYQKSHPDATGNGSLMRTGPVALAHLGDDEALATAARAISALTHPHDLAGDACVLWCIAIDRAVREGRLDGIWDGLCPCFPPSVRGSGSPRSRPPRVHRSRPCARAATW